ncbi:MAG: radical SAM protein [Pseudomonadota bacterium]|nr:radical SAM protein [Pseudomonadota bacterium]
MKTVRTLRPEDFDQARPVYTVWELTLRCDHACAHCGSRAGAARSDELTTAELLEVAASVVRLGTREVTIIGGEAYLRPDVYEIVAYLHNAGVRVTMQTGGMAFTAERARRFFEAGLAAIGVSVDGPPAIHDLLRARPGSHAAAIRALENAHDLGMITTVNTQVNRLNMGHLRETCELLRDKGIRVWRPQLTVPMGRAADHPEWILEPWHILEVMDTLAALQVESMKDARARDIPPGRAFHVLAGNNVGYFGPHEQLLRSRPGATESWWTGCSAGKHVLGIESDGVVKGCPSLPTAPYAGGNVRDVSLEQIWATAPELAFTRERGTEDLWGFCKGCYYADICKGGCSFTSHCTLGKRGNNPFCYHRADTLRKQGKRERLVSVVKPEGLPYDFGRFEIVEEAWAEPAIEPTAG